MKDLIERLRGYSGTFDHACVNEAADAIEKLEAENAALLAANKDCILHFDTLKTDYDALRAELAARWLPIESARPEYDTLVIVTWDNRDWEIRLCQITYDADGWLWADEYGELCEWGSDEMPTHWMPAPGAKP